MLQTVLIFCNESHGSTYSRLISCYETLQTGGESPCLRLFDCSARHCCLLLFSYLLLFFLYSAIELCGSPLNRLVNTCEIWHSVWGHGANLTSTGQRGRYSKQFRMQTLKFDWESLKFFSHFPLITRNKAVPRTHNWSFVENTWNHSPRNFHPSTQNSQSMGWGPGRMLPLNLDRVHVY